MTFQKHICLCHANSYQYPGVGAHVYNSQEPEICGFETSLDYTMRLHGEVMGSEGDQGRRGKGGKESNKRGIKGRKRVLHHPRRVSTTPEVTTTPEGFPPPQKCPHHPRRVFPGASSQSVLTHTLQTCFHCSWFNLF